ncbi:MAG: sugar transferase (PEP-CTERM/EpsH1 system associated) [Bacteroidia bacterium]
MKILFLANRIPYPPFRGDKLKIYNLAKRLCADHTLYLIAFVENKEELKHRSKLEEIFEEVHLVFQPVWRSWFMSALNIFGSAPFQLAYFKNRRMHECLADFLDKTSIDVIHTQHLRMSQYTANLKAHKRILDLPDAYSLYWERRKKVKRPFLNRIFDSIESERVVRAEHVINSYDLSLACSVEDQAHLQKLHPNAKVGLLRNGVDLETFKPRNNSYEGAEKLLFTGNMDYAPNVDAVTYFVNNLFQTIITMYPNVRLVIAGQRPVKEVLDLKSDRVEVTGFVENMADAYAAADVVIAPLRFGAGTQNKVLEAMAMGVPVVCTDIGFKGLELKSGEGVLHASNDEAFIKHVCALLESKDLRKKVGAMGIQHAEQTFSWDGIAKVLEAHFKSVIIADF